MTDAQGERIAAALERIAAVLEVVVAGQIEPPPDSAPGGCGHPTEMRVSFGVTDGCDDWLCQACGFRTVSQDETHG